MPIQMKQNTQWLTPRALPVKTAGAIKLTQTGYIKIAGGWKVFFEALKAIKFTGRCKGPAAGNNFHYETISNKAIVVQSGDVLIYEMQPHGPNIATGIDARIEQNGSFVNNLRDFKNANTNKLIVDQSGITIHPGNSVFTAGIWKYRTFDLTPCVGYTVGPWCVVFEGDTIGDYTTFFRDIKVVDANGNVRLSIFDKTLDVPDLSTYGGTSNNYVGIGKVVDASPL